MNPAKTPIWLLQQAIYGVLTDDATLMLMIEGVFDGAPEGKFPIIELGEATEIPDGSHSGFGRQTVHTMHIWTRSRGYKQGTEIANRVVALLDHPKVTDPGQVLSIDGFAVVSQKFEFLQTLPDEDPEVRHVVLRIRIDTEQQE